MSTEAYALELLHFIWGGGWGTYFPATNTCVFIRSVSDEVKRFRSHDTWVNIGKVRLEGVRVGVDSQV